MIHFSYGLYQNYQLKKEYDLSDEREIALSLQGDFDEESDKELNDDESYFKPVDSVDNYITMNLLKKYVAEFNNSFTDKLKYIEATAIVDQLPFRMNFSEKDFGKYQDKTTGKMQLCFLTNNDIPLTLVCQ